MPVAAVWANTSEASLPVWVAVATFVAELYANTNDSTTRPSNVSTVDRRRLRGRGGKRTPSGRGRSEYRDATG